MPVGFQVAWATANGMATLENLPRAERQKKALDYIDFIVTE